jgi:hypothetical protein
MTSQPRTACSLPREPDISRTAVLCTKYHYSDKMKESEMRGTRSMHVTEKSVQHVSKKM